MKKYNWKAIIKNFFFKITDLLIIYKYLLKSFFLRKKKLITFDKFEPCIVHANGGSKKRGYNKLYFEIISNCKPFKKKNFEKLGEDLSIVTWKGGYYSNKETIIEKSLKSYCIKPIILDYEGSNFWNATRQSKIFNTLKAIDNNIIKTKYFIGCDAGDVFFLQHPNKVLKKYLEFVKKFKCLSLWGAEKNSHPNFNSLRWVKNNWLDEKFLNVIKQDKINYLKHKSPFLYLNSGCYIAETKYIQKKFREIKSYYDVDGKCDQFIMRIIQKENLNEIFLDHNSEIFLNLHKVNHDEIKFLC